eukprot:8670734-Pyramimonas_sp.AAC.1
MAQKLEHEEGDVLHFLLKLNMDLVGEAKAKASAGSAKAAKFVHSKASASGSSQTAPKGGGKGNGKQGGKAGGKGGGGTKSPAPSTPPRM